MHLAHLSLANFRNYARLELPLNAGITLLVGDNAQGKSNLLEAIYFLATTKSFRSNSDRELINWLAGAEDVNFARVAARVQRGQGNVRLELLIKDAGETSKLLRVNGVAKRAMDFIGQANVVMFSPQDIDLVTGAPQLRRRYLDVTISQIDGRYVRALAHYNKVLAQRNHLLRKIKEGQGDPDQLLFWDQELTAAGGYVVVQRRGAVSALNRLVRERHGALTESGERLRIEYRSTTNPLQGQAAGTPGDVVGRRGDAEGQSGDDLEREVVAHTQVFRELLSRNQAREIAFGMSLIGPHRDDLGFILDERDAAAFGSRGQQRTIVLALRMAEAVFMQERTGEHPIVLLDDIMSELDVSRGRRVLESLDGLPQVLITSSNRQSFEPGFLARATLLTVRRGVIGSAEG